MKNFLYSIIGQKNTTNNTIPPDCITYNVDNFNLWFCDKKSNSVYGNVFLRLDKLSESMVIDYLSKCYGIETFDIKKVKSLEILIRKDWFSKINNNEI